MSGKTVKRHVSVHNPETGESETLQPGMKVPDYAKDQITNEKVFTDPEPADNEAPVNEAPIAAREGEQPEGVDGTEVGPVDSTTEPSEELGEVNETPNANPAQRQTADKPGGNQAPDNESLAPVDDATNPAASGGANPDTAVFDDAEAPEKPTKRAASKRASSRTNKS